MSANVAIMDDDQPAVARMTKSLHRDGYTVKRIKTSEELMQEIHADRIDVLILNVDANGRYRHELLPMIKKADRLLPIIVTSSDDSIELATRIREQGVFYFSLKPVDIAEIKLALKNALNRRYTHRRERTQRGKFSKVYSDNDYTLTLTAASNMLNMSTATVGTYARRGELPAKKIDRRWHFSRSQLLEWFKLHAAQHQVDFGTLILETMDEGVAILDRNLKILCCNTSYLTSHDVSRENVIGDIVRDNTEMYNTTKHLNWMMSFFVHECKSTLGTAMMGVSALTNARFARTVGAQKRSEMLLSALSSLKLLYDMIRNYVISYKDEQGTLVCQIKRCHVEKDIIEPTVREYSAILKHKNVTVRKTVHGKRTMYCDPDLVRIVLSNLINNAIKYGTPNTEIQCVYRTSNSTSELTVFNEGVGIDEDKLEDIFEKYVRFSTVGMSGTGLGLHVVRIIAEQHKGSVRAESGYVTDNTPVSPHRGEVRSGVNEAERGRPRRFARFVFAVPSGTHRRRREVHHGQ
ncbi:hypothetical protein AMJ87_02915 [candidate division WOR_3 bacterium SM23_60]|uniref:histidine kinase n=1 Tax=candidate division WOR_3 bacterium SM23_60 TaxID=1703780 RepID=A0A0S8GJI0_UNCW3|nr:MAG: hypothetical protein AMJ87_02915 [candidate division WOR_3 bacterium SM23_60]